MEPIPEELVEATWQEFATFSPLRAQKETKEVNEAQPYLLTFVVEFTRDLDQEVKELAVYIFYVVCRMFQKRSKGKIKTISPEEVISCYEKNERLMESLEGAHEKFWERIAEVQLSAQPHVMKYVIEALLVTSKEDFSIIL
ncbi:MAG: hypothetical protein JRJ29_17580, partial [Deltaproteobacteria bacterium]|nr:hypothetical protein [Deltaproteobacteria bacterium]